MASRSRAQLITDISTYLADNITGDITIEDIRTVLNNIVDSANITLTDTGTFGAYKWDGSATYYANQITNYLGNWYVANTDPTLDGVFHATEWDALDNNLYKATLNLTAAEVKNLNSTPMTIVSAVSGKCIHVVSSFMFLDYGTVAFATDTSPYIYIDTATKRLADFFTVLAGTVDRRVSGVPLNYSGALGATDTQLIQNKALKITCAANPTAGDGLVSITVFYLLV